MPQVSHRARWLGCQVRQRTSGATVNGQRASGGSKESGGWRRERHEVECGACIHTGEAAGVTRSECSLSPLAQAVGCPRRGDRVADADVAVGSVGEKSVPAAGVLAVVGLGHGVLDGWRRATTARLTAVIVAETAVHLLGGGADGCGGWQHVNINAVPVCVGGVRLAKRVRVRVAAPTHQQVCHVRVCHVRACHVRVCHVRVYHVRACHVRVCHVQVYHV